MDIVSQLSEELLKQSFSDELKQQERLNDCKQIAFNYSKVENSIAVLSDLKSNVSFIYYGGIAEQLGMAKRGDMHTVGSIWEEAILTRIHHDDLKQKHVQELRFFNFLKSIPKVRRSDYHLESIIRMRDADDIYVQVLHRMFYVASYSNGSIWLALCLYNLFAGTNPRNVIVDSLSGQQTDLVSHNCNDLLTGREKEILKLIDKGKMSKDIASLLSISVKTVSRHRQNILEKLQVNNSIEACRIAKELSLI